MDTDASRSAWVMLVARTVLFAGWQAIIAAIAWLGGSEAAWGASIGWWPVVATATNVVCIVALVRLFRVEGSRYRELFRFDRATVRADLLVVLGLGLAMVVTATVPNYLLGLWLFGDPELTVAIMFRPLPLWAIGPTLVLFPLTITLAETPTYFGYVMPRLEGQVGRAAAVGLTAFALAAQHVALPLVFDLAFVVWRLLMFLPLALLLALSLRWRPRLLPYVAIVHGLLDFSAAWMVLDVSR